MKIAKISEFSKVTTILNSDLFLYSHGRNDIVSLDNLSSYNITYGDIFTEFKGLFTDKTLNPKGHWVFTTGTNNYFGVKTENISKLSSITASSRDLSALVNYEYIQNNLLTPYLSMLFNQLYGSNSSGDINQIKWPSYIGQIVISETIDSETALRKIYGTNTRWQKIGGRILLGVGSVDANNSTRYGECNNGSFSITNKKKGGEAMNMIEDIPSHSHKFEDASFKKFPGMEWPVFGLHTDAQFEIILPNDSPGPAKRKKHHHGTGKGRGTYLFPNTSPSIFLGSKKGSKTFSFTARGSITDNTHTQTAHTNMPPVKAYHMWERIS